MAANSSNENISVARIFLYNENPRHKPVQNEAEAITALCAKEDVLQMAKDIAEHGLSPLERFAVFPVGKRTRPGALPVYFCAEGNRRLCAIKLLADPDLAPAKLRKQIQQLSEKWKPIKAVSAFVFKDFDSSRIWLDRIHNGSNAGIGRKQWTSDQKTRFDGESKNKSSLLLLDYAQEQGLISADDRLRKLTTVQRFVSNPIFRQVMGFDASDLNEMKRTREKTAFDGIVKKFITDLVGGKAVNSRMNKREIEGYAHSLESLPEAHSARIDAQPLSSKGSGKSRNKGKGKGPVVPNKAKHVRHEQAIYDALRDLGNEKLLSIYYSVCSIELEHHTPIIAIGVWAFFETLTSCAGRNDGTSFDSFLSKNRIENVYKIAGDSKSVRDALTRVASYGNTTKHHPISVTFNGDQLNNDMSTLKDLILKSIEDAKSKSP